MPGATATIRADLKTAFVKAGGKPPFIIKDPFPSVQISPTMLIQRYWNKLKGSPGKAVSDVEAISGGHRIRYEHGAIYMGGSAKHPAWVYGAIGEYYDKLGGPSSWLGFPLTDEQALPDDGGRVSTFEHGAIYWWADTGAIDINNIVVHYTGLLCFGETDWDQTSDSDEPYVVIGVLSPIGSRSLRTQIYEDVDAGESRPDLVEVYRGPPIGLAISSMVMEHDLEDPEQYTAAMTAAVSAGAATLGGLVATVPGVGALLAAAAAALLPTAVSVVVDALKNEFDFDDDVIGFDTPILASKALVTMAAHKKTEFTKGVGYKFQTALISGEGASYKACFGVVKA
nr:hypothetical protein [uncultured Cupriavidus sp.]